MLLAQQLFEGKPGGDWAAYILGCFVVLSQECGAQFTEDMYYHLLTVCTCGALLTKTVDK